MKTNKILVSVAVVTICLFAAPAFAQTDGSTEATSTEATEQPANAEPTSDPNSTYNDRVTIDEGAPSTEAANSEGSASSSQSTSRERIRVYSGKHDGNNVIYDPK